MHQPVSLSHFHSIWLSLFPFLYSLSFSISLALSPSLAGSRCFRFSICRCGRIVDLLIMDICKQRAPPLGSRFNKCSLAETEGKQQRQAAQAAEAATTTVIMLQSLSLPRPLATQDEHVNCIKPLASGAHWAHPMTPPGAGNESKRDIHSCCREIKKVYSIEIFQLGQQLHEIHFPFERKYAMIQWKYEVDFHTFLTTLYSGCPAAVSRYMALFCDLRCLFPILHSTKVLRPLKLVHSPRCTW